MSYSYRSAFIGSTRDARRAGAYDASKETASSSGDTISNAIGSLFADEKNPDTARPAGKVNARPAPMPISESTNPCRSTTPKTLLWLAPIAIRIPNSRVRRLTE